MFALATRALDQSFPTQQLGCECEVTHSVATFSARFLHFNRANLPRPDGHNFSLVEGKSKEQTPPVCLRGHGGEFTPPPSSPFETRVFFNAQSSSLMDRDTVGRNTL